QDGDAGIHYAELPASLFLCSIKISLFLVCDRGRTLNTALHRRRISALTMTVARRGTPLRECAEIIKNDAHRVFTALMIRGFVPHARQSCARVEETGHVFR
ncbi:hypothetical protein, partial [Streptococcus suis]|uniref:hypothetical protein n=1 Tax=Streptococcus suis TaxID=1307 RepID=UPI001CA568C0